MANTSRQMHIFPRNETETVQGGGAFLFPERQYPVDRRGDHRFLLKERLQAQRIAFFCCYSVYKGGVFRRLRKNCAPGGVVGAYGGPQFKATVLNGQYALYGGGPIMVILKPSWAIGLNVSTMMRLSPGVGYRFMFLFDDLPGRNGWHYSAPTAIIQLRFLAL